MTAVLRTIFYDSSLFYLIFAHACPFVKISEQLIEKVKSSGLGKLTTWSLIRTAASSGVILFDLFIVLKQKVLFRNKELEERYY